MAGYYARYRRGYPTAGVDAIAGAFGPGMDDLVVDLGCGTGQLSLPMAARVRAVVGMDPEPDMLMLARRAATERGLTNVSSASGSSSGTSSDCHRPRSSHRVANGRRLHRSSLA